VTRDDLKDPVSGTERVVARNMRKMPAGALAGGPFVSEPQQCGLDAKAAWVFCARQLTAFDSA
jgi:hypothetical protein